MHNGVLADWWLGRGWSIVIVVVPRQFIQIKICIFEVKKKGKSAIIERSFQILRYYPTPKPKPFN